MDSYKFPSDRLILAIHQSLEKEEAKNALIENNIDFVQMSEAGDFLGSRKVTLLIHSNGVLWNSILRLLKRIFKQRIEVLPIIVDNLMAQSRSSTCPIATGGAEIITLDIESYEEF